MNYLRIIDASPRGLPESMLVGGAPKAEYNEWTPAQKAWAASHGILEQFESGVFFRGIIAILFLLGTTALLGYCVHKYRSIRPFNGDCLKQLWPQATAFVCSLLITLGMANNYFSQKELMLESYVGALERLVERAGEGEEIIAEANKLQLDSLIAQLRKIVPSEEAQDDNS